MKASKKVTRQSESQTPNSLQQEPDFYGLMRDLKDQKQKLARIMRLVKERGSNDPEVKKIFESEE